MTLDPPHGGLPEARAVRWNPTPEELRELTSLDGQQRLSG